MRKPRAANRGRFEDASGEAAPVPGKPQPVRALLESSALASIRAELAEQARLLRTVREGVPEFLSAHCLYAIAKGDRLLIYVDSPAWGSQLRFYGPSLLERLERTTGYGFKELQVRNLLSAVGSPARRSEPRLAPPQAALGELLRRSAETAPGELKEALKRLCRAVESLREVNPP